MYVYTRFCFIDLDVYFCVLCLFSGAFLKDSRQSASLFTVCLQDEVVQSDRQAVFEKWNFRSVTESWMQLSAERLCYMSNLDQVHFFFQLGEGGVELFHFSPKRVIKDLGLNWDTRPKGVKFIRGASSFPWDSCDHDGAWDVVFQHPSTRYLILIKWCLRYTWNSKQQV